MTILGILGGGYLSRLTTQAAQKIGVNVAVVDKNEHSPASQVTAYAIEGDWNDAELLIELAETCDAITIESEAVPADVLRQLEAAGAVVRPSSATIATLADRLTQKQALAARGFPTVAFAAVDSLADVTAFFAAHSYGVVLKTCVSDGDSHGIEIIRAQKDLQAAYDKLAPQGPLMVEAYEHTYRELSICGARGQDGAVKLYPVGEFKLQHGVVYALNAPVHDRFQNYLAEKGRQPDAIYFDGIDALATRIAEAFAVIGAFGVELFEARDGRILVNDVSARPGIQGVYTVDACAVSLFENHARAVLGMPLGWTDMAVPRASTVTILGKSDALPSTEDFAQAFSMRGAHFHWYGKPSSYRLRKLGHVTGMHSTDAEAERIAGMTSVALLGW
jgi:phosphoribosylaminoimidazole carboxylase PurK protein